METVVVSMSISVEERSPGGIGGAAGGINWCRKIRHGTIETVVDVGQEFCLKLLACLGFVFLELCTCIMFFQSGKEDGLILIIGTCLQTVLHSLPKIMEDLSSTKTILGAHNQIGKGIKTKVWETETIQYGDLRLKTVGQKEVNGAGKENGPKQIAL